jgi:uncharacterized UBP type Zn finger protein
MYATQQKSLVEMGFDGSEALQALQICKGNVDAATAMLLGERITSNRVDGAATGQLSKADAVKAEHARFMMAFKTPG